MASGLPNGIAGRRQDVNEASGRDTKNQSAGATAAAAVTSTTSSAPGPSSASTSTAMEGGSKISLTSATLKRNPKMELNRSDLLRLLGVLEGELQAREVVIAVLKAEQTKRLLYPNLRQKNSKAKQGATALGSGTVTMIPNNKLTVKSASSVDQQASSDPYSALLRDSCDAFEPSFDEHSTKAIFKLQLRQLDFLVDRQQKTRHYLKSQLEEVNLKYNAVFNELEYEKQRAEEFDREKLFKRVDELETENGTLRRELEAIKENLEAEREREKKMIVCLLGERKQLIVKLIDEKDKNSELVQLLDAEKSKISEMVEGLEEESKRSLQMELDLERLGLEYDSQKDMLKEKLLMSETRNVELTAEVDRLRHELDHLRISRAPVPDLGEGARSTIVTVASAGHRGMPTVSSVAAVNPPKASIARPVSPSRSTVPAPASAQVHVVSARPVATQQANVSSSYATVQPASARVTAASPAVPAPQTSVASPVLAKSPAAPTKTPVATAFQNLTYGIAIEPTSNAAPTSGVPVNAIQPGKTPESPALAATAVKRPSVGSAAAALRGAPPPVPPNKPVLPAQVLKERSKELQAGVVARAAKLIAPNASVVSPVAKALASEAKAGEIIPLQSTEVSIMKQQVHVEGSSSSSTTTNGNGVGAEGIENGVDMLCQELADFQQLLVSMVSPKGS